MADVQQKASFYFVTFDDVTTGAPGRKAAEKSKARAHAARVTHSRRKAKRGQTVVKWIVEGPESHVPDASAHEEKSRPIKTESKFSPRSLLSQAKVDPFIINEHALLPARLQQILENSYESIHSKLITASSPSEVANIKVAWRRIGQEWPVMFHLQVASAANLVRADVTQDELSSELEALRIKHHSRGAKMVRKELDIVHERKERASDALIMAMVMGALITDPIQTQYFEGFRLSPLATTQNLHLYARLEIVPPMIEVLVRHVTQRGGLQAMREFGNAQLLQFADLMISSRLGLRPRFDWLNPRPSILDGPAYKPDTDAMMMRRIIGSAFYQLEPIDLELANVLKSASEVTVALEHYEQCRPNAPNQTDMVNAANETHHRLLRIKANTSWDPSPSPSKMDFLRNACRLAGLIYDDFVLFPLPPTAEARPRLVRELRHAIEKFDILEQWEADVARGEHGSTIGEYNNLVMWTLMLGALASLTRPEKPFFVAKLQQYLDRVPWYAEWSRFSNVMSNYLWWDHIFYEPAMRLWQEIVPPPTPVSTISHRSSTESLYQKQSPTDLSGLMRQHSRTTELGTHGLPTPGSDHSPLGSTFLHWPHTYS